MDQARLDFEKFRAGEQVPSQTAKQCWFTVLQVDGSQSGHTSIKVTSDLRPVLYQEGQKKPAIVVQTGHTKREALEFRDAISKDNGKQVRGIHSRGGNADVIATSKGYPGWIDSELVFGVDETEAARVPYVVGPDLLPSGD
jgi:hypothetical protein